LDNEDEIYKPALRARLRWRLQAVKHNAITRWRRACDWLKWLGYEESDVERHAREELRLAGWFDKDGFYGDLMGHAVMRMLREFAEEGHSGMSAGAAISIFERLARFEPLTPLTGEDDEWGEPYEYNGTRQNKRCSHVFKDANGYAYDIEGRIFREPSGACYTSYESRVPVTFPYTPKREYVDVPEAA
jgi:hypothetical protein